MGGIVRFGSGSRLLTTIGVVIVLSMIVVPVSSSAMVLEGNLVAVDFENVELRVFIKFVSEVTGRIFLIDDRVRGQISVRFANRIPVEGLYEVLESVLEVKGYVAVPAGSITKIVPLNTAKQRGIEVTGRGSGPQGAYR
jgi:general secretion pathway protein D